MPLFGTAALLVPNSSSQSLLTILKKEIQIAVKIIFQSHIQDASKSFFLFVSYHAQTSLIIIFIVINKYRDSKLSAFIFTMLLNS